MQLWAGAGIKAIPINGQAMTKVFLDYETKSCVPIEDKGLSNYASDATTEIILAAYAVEDRAPKLWQPHLNPELPSDLADYLADPWYEIHSWNVAFERAITECVLGIPKPISEWRDPSVMCKYVSLPGSLEDAGVVLGLKENQAKIKDGKRLIRKFCIPESLGGEVNLFGISKPCFRGPYTDPADWELFGEYCKQDVVAERTVEHKLYKMPVPDFEWDLWELDQAINSRGIPVSLDLVRGARAIALTERTRLLQRLKELTELDNPNSNEQMLGFLKEKCGYPFGSLGKAFVTRAMAGEGSLNGLGREVLEIRKMSSKSSINKFELIADNVSPDGRLRHQFVFYGAAKTGRWSGKDAQLQNLARPTKEVEDRMDLAVNLVRLTDYDAIVREFSQPLDVVSSVVRAAFEAPEGSHFTVADLAGIETRVIGWVSRCRAILDVFRLGNDPYLTFGAKMFNKPYEEVTKEERQKAKAPVLACLGGETPVLTSKGWKSIRDIMSSDRLWDGVAWIVHGGVVSRGVKETIDLFGVRSTPDHLILTSQREWKQSCEVMQSGLYARSAIDLANGSLPDPHKISKVNCITRVAVKVAELKNWFIEEISKKARLNLAFPAPINESTKCWEASIFGTQIMAETALTAWPIDTMQSSLAATEREAQPTDTRDEELFPNLRMCTTSSVIALPWSTARRKNTRWTVSTTTATMPREISDSLRPKSITATKRFFSTLCGTAKKCVRKSSGKDSVRNTENLVAFVEKSEKEFPWGKSSLNRTTAEVPTFDILNAGPLNRFTILTTSGPLLVHNCGFGLGGGEEQTTEDGDTVRSGLWGYAQAMQIELTQEEAARSVKVYRETYPEVVKFWRELQDAAISAIRNPSEEFTVGPITFSCLGKKVLCIRLPSGRSLHYIKPHVTMTETEGKYGTYKRAQVYYEGKDQKTHNWGTSILIGSKICENIVQAIARDILVHGMKQATKAGFDIVLHVHDEIGSLVKDGSHLTLELLCQCMTNGLEWAPELPLEASGYEAKYYKK